MEPITSDTFSKKIIPVSRIKSVSEKYILTDYVDGDGFIGNIKKTIMMLKSYCFNLR